MVLKAIKYTSASLSILDQLALPHREIYISIENAEEAWDAIRSMRVRGAPAIAIVAALALAVEIGHSATSPSNSSESDARSSERRIKERLDYLVTSRPTAVNLGDAAGKLSATVHDAANEHGATGRSVKDAYIAAAEQMLVDDVSDNEAIGRHGAEWILQRAGERRVSVLTHCNTGSLATAGFGTALGVVRALHASSRLHHVYYTETRPYNQGSRLTGYELLHDGIPCTLITDSMAGALLSRGGPRATTAQGDDGTIAAIVVGADRVAANGDTANKIGTYGLAVLARWHGVAFLVAAPRTTVDLKTASGKEIVIEERKEREVVVVKGPKVLSEEALEIDVDDVREVSIAAEGTRAWNPAFDVTPAELIDGIVTEVGVAEKAGGRFMLETLFGMGKGPAEEEATRPPERMPSPSEGP